MAADDTPREGRGERGDGVATDATVPITPGAAPAEATELSRGARLGRYVVLHRLGGGGMGIVYAAYDPELDRKVALKLLWASASAGEGEASDGRARLLREAQAMARLQHPNVIAVHDVGTVGEQVFVAMELVDGKTLTQWQKLAAHTWREVVAIYSQAGRGLAAAHAAGLVHRDFKPDNVLCGSDGRVRVLDFGLARGATELGRRRAVTIDPVLAHSIIADRTLPSSSSGGALSSPITRVGSLVGTPAYMAPEQLRREATDARTDQFGFCVALYEGLHGRRPFTGQTLSALTDSVVNGRVLPPLPGRAVPSWLHRLLVRGLSPLPQDRFPSMDALLVELGRDPEARRRRWIGRVAAVVVVLSAIGGAAALRRQQASVCSGGQRQLDGVWDAGRRQSVRAAFAATGSPLAEQSFTSVSRLLDAYSGRWAWMHRDACEATRVRGEQSEELLDLRMACLAQRRQELAALVDLFAHADRPLVEAAIKAAGKQSELESCADLAMLKLPLRPPSNPATRARVDAVREQIARGKALEHAGRYAEGLVLARAAVEGTRTLAYRPVEAEALTLRGDLEDWVGDPRTAADTQLDAALAAEAGRHDEVAAHAWTSRLYELYMLARHDEAHQAARQAAASIERLGGNDQLHAVLVGDLGILLHDEGKLVEAEAAYREAIALQEKLHGPDDPHVASPVNNLGTLLHVQRKNEAALASFRRALDLWRKQLGPDHPDVAYALHNIGNVLRDMHRYPESRQALEQALAIRERTLGVDHPSTALTLIGLAEIDTDEGHVASALPLLERALRSYEKSFGTSHRDLGLPLTDLGRVHRLLGQSSVAVPLLERALVLRQGLAGGEEDLAITQSELGQALWETGQERPRARWLVTEAQAHFASPGPHDAQRLAEVDAWLATHRARRGP